ncbi:hypothetical protein V1477_021119 [Vespula maculifrons]|uniref:Uncharacterized protein n=1 Tax=Vespula maculifrons TaxID=7453 RepID=A0ABD2AH87_VESMC
MLHWNDVTKRRNIPFLKDRNDIIDCVRKSSCKGPTTMQAGPSSMKTRNGTEGCLSCKRYTAPSSNYLVGLMRGKHMKKYFPSYKNKTGIIRTHPHRIAHATRLLKLAQISTHWMVRCSNEGFKTKVLDNKYKSTYYVHLISLKPFQNVSIV